MALYLTTEFYHRTFWVQDFNDMKSFIALERVVKVQADSDELQAIYNRFSFNSVPTIPMPFPLTGHTVVTWTGEMAVFIAQNLI